MKSLKAANITDARVIMHLDRGEIEIIIGAGASAGSDQNKIDPMDDWSDDCI